MDILGASIGQMAFMPILVMVAISIRWTSSPPVFFLQIRVGRGDHDFILTKFRTMRDLPEVERGSFDAGNAMRVTPIGKYLRKWKLDEFPQLWNVLKGEMSLVGPRPEAQKWVETYPDRWARVLVMRPGIMDPAAILCRNEENMLAQSGDPERRYRDVVLPHNPSTQAGPL